MMITLLSPAKTLDFETPVHSSISSNPLFKEEPKKIISKLKSLSRKRISELMNLSENLADLNYQRYQMWTEFPDANVVRQAVMMFKGEVYLGLEATEWNDQEIDFAQNHLRILSGLYGYLKPMDSVQAYRLEMGTKLPMGKTKDLYQFWGDKISNAINSELENHAHKVVVNLASNEYYKAAKSKNIQAEMYTPVFKDAKNGEFKMISFFAKKARGTMAKWIVQNEIDNPNELVHFAEDGYAYNDSLSKKYQPVFTRG